MSYFYNPEGKYIYDSSFPYFPTDIPLTNEYAQPFLNLNDEAKQLIQIGKKGLPIVAPAKPNPFYKWDQDKETWLFDEDVKKREVFNFINQGKSKLDDLKTCALIHSDLFNNDKGNRTKIQYLYYASKDYLNNNTTVDKVLELYAFYKNQPLKDVANSVVDEYETLNLKLIACDWYKNYLETKFNNLGNEYSDYEKYLETIQSLTCDEVLTAVTDAKNEASKS